LVLTLDLSETGDQVIVSWRKFKPTAD